MTETALFSGTREKKDSPRSHTQVSALSALGKECFQTPYAGMAADFLFSSLNSHEDVKKDLVHIS